MSALYLTVAVVAAVAGLRGVAHADPETVDGLYLTKKDGRQAAEVGHGGQRAFHQAHLGQRPSDSKAFAHFLAPEGKPVAAGDFSEQNMGVFGKVLTRTPAHSPGAMPEFPGLFGKPALSPSSVARAATAATSDVAAKSSVTTAAFPSKSKAPSQPLNTIPTEEQRPSEVTTKVAQVGDPIDATAVSGDSPASKVVEHSDSTDGEEEKEEEGSAAPVALPLASDAGLSPWTDGRNVTVGVVIGIVFLLAFAGIAIGLTTRHFSRSGGLFPGDGHRTPTSDDQTPPELRPGGADKMMTRGAHKGRGWQQQVFSGKLVLHDPPGLSADSFQSSCFHPTSMTSTLFAAQAAVLMPSPAEHITDGLLSPLDESEDAMATEDDDSDDTVYECPGLAATDGEMVVNNPFYLRGGDLDLPQLEANAVPQPISRGSMFHREMKGVN